MCKNTKMDNLDDSERLVQYLNVRGIAEPDDVKPGWAHVGAIALDAAIQPQRDYEKVVRPRVERLIAEHPAASTTSGFLALAASKDLTEVVNYAYTERVNLAVRIAEVFRDHGIETSENLQDALNDDESRVTLRAQLGRLKFVGPKTLGYIDILAGSAEGVAIDSRVLRVLANAGITNVTYDQAETVIRAAASKLEWSVGGLDAVLWRIGERPS